MLIPYSSIINGRSSGRTIKVEGVNMNNSNVPFLVRDDDFRKSSWSKNNPKTCVLVAKKPEGVALRDSKDPDKKTLFFNHEEWDAFLAGVKGGEF